MAIGRDNESTARFIYSNYYKITVTQAGLVIPKFDVGIGAIPDGIVSNDRILEIKCPVRIYPELYGDESTICSRIHKSHYDQMQGSMAIMNVKSCDYFVYGVEEMKYICITVPYDPLYWWYDLYPN